MGKATYRGPVQPDDPMFTGGVEFFRKTDCKAEETNTETNEPLQPQFEAHRELEVDWAGDRYSVQIDKATLQRISQGKEIIIEVFEEQYSMYIHWHFNSDPLHNLIIDLGDPNGIRWLGNIEGQLK